MVQIFIVGWSWTSPSHWSLSLSRGNLARWVFRHSSSRSGLPEGSKFSLLSFPFPLSAGSTVTVTPHNGKLVWGIEILLCEHFCLNDCTNVTPARGGNPQLITAGRKGLQGVAVAGLP